MSNLLEDVHAFFAGGKKTSIFWHRVLGIQIMDENNAVRGWNLQNTRIVPNPGDVLVVDSQLILFTYYNTEDSEWMNHQANKPTWAEHVSMCKQNPEQSGLGWKIQASSDKTAGFSRRGRGSTRKSREELTVITCHHIMFIYTIIYCLSYLIIISKNIYPSHTPPCSLTIRPSYSCNCRNCRHLLRCQTLWVWLPAMKTMVALGAEAKATRKSFPTKTRGFPLMCFGGGFQKIQKKKTTKTNKHVGKKHNWHKTFRT